MGEISTNEMGVREQSDEDTPTEPYRKLQGSLTLFQALVSIGLTIVFSMDETIYQNDFKKICLFYLITRWIDHVVVLVQIMCNWPNGVKWNRIGVNLARVVLLIWSAVRWFELDIQTPLTLFMVVNYIYTLFEIWVFNMGGCCFLGSVISRNDNANLSTSLIESATNTLGFRDFMRMKTAEDRECSVCIEKFTEEDEMRILKCGHFYHTRCITEWLRVHNSCPICRKDIVGNPSIVENT